MAASDYLEDAVLQHVFEGAALTQPTVWVGLSVGAPLDDGSGLNEPDPGDGYARVRPDDEEGRWEITEVGGTTTAENKGDVRFPEATGGWGEITHVALFDAESHGNMLAHFPLNVPTEIGLGDSLVLYAGNLIIELD